MEPKEPPPSYNQAQASSSATTSFPQQPKTRNGIPPHTRRSMEDESRPLPSGWIRQYDSETHHQFFVDTSASPPRSIWHHPYDDSTYLASLDIEERQRVQNLHRVPTHADIEAESSDEGHHGHDGAPPTAVHKFGRKMKDKMTGSTHVQREEKRRRREEEEREAYRQHVHMREQMARAAETGEPQFLGRDRDGREVFVEPPPTNGGPEYAGAGFGGRGGGPYGGGFVGNDGGGLRVGGYGYNPYPSGPERGGVYAEHPNARFIRPQGPYARPYGGGFGGGYGMPMLGYNPAMMMGGVFF
ncbi:hypothetical protein V8E51_008458 [Hyaloscypha variabilis]